MERLRFTFTANGKRQCGCEWRHMIAVAMNITAKGLIIHEAESTYKYHHKNIR